MGNGLIPKVEEEKDLGVMLRNDLSPEITRDTFMLLKNILVTSQYTDEEMKKKLIVSINLV